MSTTLPVSYSHLIEGFTKGVDRNGGPFYHVVYKIADWDSADDFVNALVGAGTLTGPVTGGKVTRNTPHFHPLSPNLACVSATVVQGLGNPVLNAAGYPDYDGGALIQAEYRPLPWDAITPNANNSIDSSTPLTYCSQSISFSTEVYTVNSGLADKPPAKITLAITILNLTFHDLPYLPMTAVRNLIGKVNSGTFLGAAAGCVLFKGADTERKFNTDGSIVQQVKMCFHERRVGFEWNKLPSKSNPFTWSSVSDTNGNTPFQTADLSPLVQL